jgi:hypothetical protein
MPPSGPINENQLSFRAVMPWHEGLRVKNVFAGTLAVGTLVCVNGTTTDPSRGDDVFATVTKADADAAAPAGRAVYVVTEAMVQSAYGAVGRYLVLRGIDTSTYATVGDPAYLSTTAGLTTPAAPTSGLANVQRVGYCAKKSSTQGIIVYDLRSNGVEKLGASALTQTVNGDSVANVTSTSGGPLTADNIGVPVVLSLGIPTGLSGNVDFTSLPYKLRVQSIEGVKITGSGGGGAGTVQVMNGATSDAISSAISINVADQTVLASTTLDDAYFTLAAGATIRVVRTRTASTNEACILYLNCIRVA